MRQPTTSAAATAAPSSSVNPFGPVLSSILIKPEFRQAKQSKPGTIATFIQASAAAQVTQWKLVEPPTPQQQKGLMLLDWREKQPFPGKFTYRLVM